MSSLERCLHYSVVFLFISKIIHIYTCTGIQTYVNVICWQYVVQFFVIIQYIIISIYHEKKEIQNSKSNYKWNTEIFMYLDNDVHVGSSCNLIILHD